MTDIDGRLADAERIMGLMATDAKLMYEAANNELRNINAELIQVVTESEILRQNYIEAKLYVAKLELTMRDCYQLLTNSRNFPWSIGVSYIYERTKAAMKAEQLLKAILFPNSEEANE